jgi:hypothetical protein
MAIGDRIKECIDKFNGSDFENALVQLSIAFDGTAKKEYPSMKSGERFTTILRDNQDIITYFTFAGNKFIDCVFDGYKLEDIIYRVLRCGLIHEGSVPEEIEFVDEIVLGRQGGRWRFPKTYVLGGLLAVIGAKGNANEKVPAQYRVVIKGKPYRVSNLLGRSIKIREIMTSAQHRLQRTAASPLGNRCDLPEVAR